MDRHTANILKSTRRIHREILNRKVAQAKRFKHGWFPDDKKPIIGVNADPTTRADNPYVVLRNVTYVHALLKELIIAEGTLTDLGSIPWLLKVVPGLRPTDPGMRMFLVHDECYRKQLCERRLADTLMESGLVADGMAASLAALCYWGVRLGGAGAYERYAREAA